MAAMVAGEAVDEAVLDHPRGAVRALDAVAAGAAQSQRRKAAAVEEQQALRAERDVTVRKVNAKKGDSLAVDAVIMEFV